jgi:hypothetical protein
MNVRKIVGRCLMGLGLFLMFVGTVSVPSTSSAAVGVVEPCNASCNKCGTPQRQGDGSYKCLKQQGGVVMNGTCDNAPNIITCTGCAGTCSEVQYEGEYSCACDI